MKGRDDAKQQGIRYETAWRWFGDGKIKGHRVSKQTVMIDEGEETFSDQRRNQMQRVEQHVINKKDTRYAAIDAAAYASKNLYNAALYEIRHAFIQEGKYLNYGQMDTRMQPHEAYKALPSKVAQQVLRLLEKNWNSFFEAVKAYKETSSKFKARPRLPTYKHKTQGRNVLVYTMQAVSRGKRTLQRRIIVPSGLDIQVKTQQDSSSLAQVRIVPKHGFYVVEVVYELEPTQTDVDPALCAGIDIGMNTLAALTSNKPGFVPVIVNGRGMKATNHYYNKRKAQLQKSLGETKTTPRMERLTNKRNRRIDHDLHTVSRFLVELLVSEGIGTLAIGKNDGWKQEAHLGHRTNQHFVQIPHALFIQMLTYKAEAVGIRVLLTEESYTSKASFLDRDPLPRWKSDKKLKPIFSGKRITRGLYRAKDGTLINADINGASNIIRKVVPNAFGPKGIEDGVGHSPVVHPVRIVIPRTNPKTTARPGTLRIR